MKYFKHILESFCEMEMEKSPKAFGDVSKYFRHILESFFMGHERF